MTREEAIEVLKDIYNYTRFDTYTTNEARTMAIKALEQEPCDDCVSRQAVRDFAKTVKDNSVFFAPTYADFDKYLAKLPSVLPKREQGEWIEKVHNFEKCWAECSVCGKTASGRTKDTGWGYMYSYTDYCPNCGAEMR